MASEHTKRFTVRVKGDLTGELFYGAFSAKTMLTLRDVLRRDQRRRELIGGMALGPDPDPDALGTATCLAELAVRIVDAPPWWDGADGGIDLVDANVVLEVFKAAMAAEREALERIRAAGAEAAKAIAEDPGVKEAGPAVARSSAALSDPNE